MHETFVIGFTGSRIEPTHQQLEMLARLLEAFLERIRKPVVGLHGDCVGADAFFDATCEQLDIPRVCYPCTISGMRAGTSAKQLFEPQPPLVRNRMIANESDILIACPKENDEVTRSGTWSTVRYARHAKKPIVIVKPGGMFIVETPCASSSSDVLESSHVP